MKVLVWAIAFVVCLPLTLQAQERLGPGWSTYRSEVAKVEFEYPAHWVVQELKPPEGVFTPPAVLISPTDSISEEGLPTFPNPWIIASLAENRVCPIHNQIRSKDAEPKLAFDFGKKGKAPETFQEAYVCLEGVEFLIAYYDADPDKRAREKLLKLVLEKSVRKIE